MTRGKQTCRILKEIRRQIAEANNIEYVTSECRFKGECAGTCPLCEAEVRYLEQELHLRRVMGKAVVLAGLSVEMIGMAACSTPSQETTVENRPCTADTSVIADLSADRPVILEEIDSIEANDSFPKASSASKNVKKRTQKNNPEYLDLDTANWMMGDIPSEKPAVYKDYYYDDESGLRVSLALSEWATFPGGTAALDSFVQENIQIPPNCVKGVVVVSALIDSVGNIVNPHVDYEVRPEMKEEALRLVRMMPNFVPAKLNGVPITTSRNIAIRFNLPGK